MENINKHKQTKPDGNGNPTDAFRPVFVCSRAKLLVDSHQLPGGLLPAKPLNGILPRLPGQLRSQLAISRQLQNPLGMICRFGIRVYQITVRPMLNDLPIPPILEATTGSPEAIASTFTSPNASCSWEGHANKSASRNLR